MLLCAPGSLQRDDDALDRLLGGSPADLPLALELPHPSWAGTRSTRAAEHGVTLVATDRDGRDRSRTCDASVRAVYLRLRRTTYTADDLERWAERLAPFLRDGTDAYVFFRHDEDGRVRARARPSWRRAVSVWSGGHPRRRYGSEASPA